MLHRLTSAGLGALLLLASFAFSASGRAATFGELVIFGDSYSDWQYSPYTAAGVRAPFRYWPESLKAAGYFKSLRNYAKAGAFAQDGKINIKLPRNERRTFKAQIDAWIAGGAPLKSKAVCAVYLGYNDIQAQAFATLGNLANSRDALARGVDRLIGRGCTAAGRYLLLVRVHQWCRNPKSKNISCSRTTTFNGYVDQVARERGAGRPDSRIRVVDVYTLFENIFARPGDYGYTNIATPSEAAGKSGSTILYWDENHFGWLGHKSIAKAFQKVLNAL